MIWLPRGDDFASDSTGRFDLIHAPDGWQAIDWDGPTSERRMSLDKAKKWCEARVKQTNAKKTVSSLPERRVALVHKTQ